MDRELTILLVEDNPGDALLIKEMMRDSDYGSASIIVAPTLAAAKKEDVPGKRIGLVLLDLSLPDSDGMASIHSMRKQFPDSTLIVLTGLNDETLAINALKEGAQNYLLKGEIDEKILGRSIRYAMERHEIMNKLKMSEEKFSRLFYSSPMIVMITSLTDGTILSANDECLKAFEYSKEEMIGKSTQQLNLWLDLNDRKELMRMLEKDGVIKNYESRFISKSGKIGYGLVSTEILQIPEGRVLVTFANDISHLKKTEAALKESETQLRDTFNELNTYLYKSSHDLRSPTANINAALSLLAKQGQASTNFEHYLKIIGDCCGKIDDMTQKLSLIASVNYEKEDNEPVNIEIAFDEALNVIGHRYSSADLLIRKTKVTGLSFNSGKRLLKVLFVQLISNAINYKHIARPLKITLSADQCEDFVTLTFSDNGIGIPASEVHKTFDLFFHSDSSVKSSGLELNIVKKIVTKLRGKVTVESESGTGTHVIMHFPVSLLAGRAGSA